MHSYTAYGINIQSEILLPGLPPARGSVDVVIRRADFTEAPAELRARSLDVRVSTAEASLALEGVGVFVVRGGRQVVVYPAPGVRVGLLRRHLIGNILAILMFQRGHAVLHASVVNLAGQGVAFIGQSGTGKSTSAAVLQARGHPLVADDAAVLCWDQRRVRVMPGVPVLKLSRAAALCAGIEPPEGDEPDSQDGKHHYRRLSAFSGDPVDLNRLCFLRRGGAVSVAPLTAHQAMVELIRHTIPTRFGVPGDAHHFQQCVELSRRIPAFRLTLPDTLEKLPRAAAQLEALLARSADGG